MVQKYVVLPIHTCTFYLGSGVLGVLGTLEEPELLGVTGVLGTRTSKPILIVGVDN